MMKGDTKKGVEYCYRKCTLLSCYFYMFEGVTGWKNIGK